MGFSDNKRLFLKISLIDADWFLICRAVARREEVEDGAQVKPRLLRQVVHLLQRLFADGEGAWSASYSRGKRR